MASWTLKAFVLVIVSVVVIGHLDGTSAKDIPMADMMDSQGPNLVNNVVEDGGSKRYYIFYGPTTWSEARLHCRVNGGILAEILNETDMTEILDMLPVEEYNRFWLGGTDQWFEGDWYWASSGHSVPSEYWGHGEPNGHEGENCLELKDGKFNDLDCDSSSHGFICQYDY